MNNDAQPLPDAFAHLVLTEIQPLLQKQRADGGIDGSGAHPVPSMAILPLAIVYTGAFGKVGESYGLTRSQQIKIAITRLGEWLMHCYQEDGAYRYDSSGLEQRLLYTWIEALHLLREKAPGEFDLAAWGPRIEAGCRVLVTHRLQKLVGIKRFCRRFVGTGLNHAMLYSIACYRAGKILEKPDLAELSLDIARALAADVHPDGYWEEHGDLLRRGGPTPVYNYLTYQGCALFYEWTGEAEFARAVEQSARFHSHFCYPDALPLDVIDERVRFDHAMWPSTWGLHGFSFTPEGRGAATSQFRHWNRMRKRATSEDLARMCDNFLYWHEGPVATAPYERTEHRARLGLPGGIARLGAWAVGVNAMAALTPEDPEYRTNPFTLDYQKLFSVWHEKTGLLLDGSHSKHQPAHSTFRAPATQADDYYPIGGEVELTATSATARAAYKTFRGDASLEHLSDGRLRLTLTAHFDGNAGPVRAGFTLVRTAQEIRTGAGEKLPLDEERTFETQSLGGGLTFGSLQIQCPANTRLSWPLPAHNPYSDDHKCAPAKWQPHVTVELTRENPAAVFELSVE